MPVSFSNCSTTSFGAYPFQVNRRSSAAWETAPSTSTTNAVIAILVFAALGEGVGHLSLMWLIVSRIVALPLIAGLASFRMKPLHALGLAVAVTVFSTLVFSYALGLPFRRIGPWLTF